MAQKNKILNLLWCADLEIKSRFVRGIANAERCVIATKHIKDGYRELYIHMAKSKDNPVITDFMLSELVEIDEIYDYIILPQHAYYALVFLRALKSTKHFYFNMRVKYRSGYRYEMIEVPSRTALMMGSIKHQWERQNTITV